MPSRKHQPALQPLTDKEQAAGDQLRADVTMLATTIGGRDGNNYRALGRAADYLVNQLRSIGYAPERQIFPVDRKDFQNIEAELRGTADAGRVIVVGAHYDSAGGLPGAHDNASGVAACLYLARTFSGQPQKATVRSVFFTNEQPPYFQSAAMGSMVYMQSVVMKETSPSPPCSRLKQSVTTPRSLGVKPARSASIPVIRIEATSSDL